MTFTVVYLNANTKPHETSKVEVQADSHQEALEIFINLPGHGEDFVAATFAGPAHLVGNTRPGATKGKRVH